MFVILVRGKEGEAQRFAFDQAVVTIGRSEINDIVLPATSVSKRHAHLVRNEDGFVLSDRESTNGTYVNGRKLLTPTLINEADHVHIGDFIIAVSVPVEPTAEEPADVAEDAALLELMAADDAPASAESATGPLSAESRHPPSAEKPSARSGALRGLRLSWLDEWMASAGQGGPAWPRELPWQRIYRRRAAEVGTAAALLVHARLPALIVVQQTVLLHLRVAPPDDAAPPAPGAAAGLEITLCFPDGGVEALDADRALLLCPAEGSSGELALRLRGRDAGPARVEIAVCHRGARLATLVLRAQVRAPGDEAAAATETETRAAAEGQSRVRPVAAGVAPQLVLRVREGLARGARGHDDAPLALAAGGVVLDGGGVVQARPSAASPTLRLRRPSLTAVRSAPAADVPDESLRAPARSRHLQVELLMVRGDWTEVLASAALTLPAPLSERMRAFYASHEVEHLALLRAAPRERVLRGLGEALTELLLPGPVHETLAAMPPGAFLQIDASESSVPWELLRIGRGSRAAFLAEHFALTRGGPGSGAARFALAPRLLVAPAEEADGMAALRREQQALGALDPRLLRVSRLAEILPYLQLPSEAAEARPQVAGLHISGPGIFARGDKHTAVLQLADGVLLPTQLVPAQRFLRHGLRPPLRGAFVFLNVGVSAVERPRPPISPAGTAPWIERLFSAGAGAVVATSWPVPEEAAAQFSDTFYRAWAGRRPLAVALAEAREAIRADGDASWLAYAAYGLCGATLERAAPR